MKNFLKLAVAGLIALGISRGVAYMVGAVQTQQQVTEISQRADNPKSESVINKADAKTEWMKACDTGEFDGANFDQNAYCACTFEKVVQNHGLNKIAQLALNGSDQELETLMQDEINYCLGQQGVEV
jgi:hypothetical protein